ncbi:hypothetical protein [Pedobacter rhodius]|uniref:CSD domain-containing protein n=1 Tax=Pedobacter rhodius TaxID=3004098 RepID=A0ABT4KUM9_9SPHI|nr:hypothetical protein [Pedobacter sp. SJ11]MCZ4222626.1 hypothetical protein [Pedobacter sp. SJ11]
MLRKGTITSLEEDGSGIITDENEQEICFKLEKSMLENLTGTPVSFEIELTDEGLIAVDVQLNIKCIL